MNIEVLFDALSDVLKFLLYTAKDITCSVKEPPAYSLKIPVLCCCM